MSGLDSQRSFCKACGLHKPCSECGKTRLSVVPTERTFTRDQVRAAFENVNQGLAGYDVVTADSLIDALEGV